MLLPDVVFKNMIKVKKLLTLIMLALMPVSALALEFRSVAVAKATLYDAPSISAKKIFLLSQYYPVEIIVNLGEWLKVRDSQGSISWVEAKQLSAKRMVMMTNSSEIKQSAESTSTVVATLEKGIVLEVLDAQPVNGWIKVKHRDGATGYVPISVTWGFN